MLDPITLAHRKHLVQSFASRGLIIDRGEGASLITRDGTRYLDLLTNYGVNILGHSHPAITAALHTQIDALINLHGSFANTSRAQALSALASVTPSHLQRVYFASGGAEAVESAIKFACRHTSKTHIIAMSGGYHGKSLGALSLTTSSDRTYQR